jgi:uncharacterized membrane protein YfcA
MAGLDFRPPRLLRGAAIDGRATVAVSTVVASLVGRDMLRGRGNPQPEPRPTSYAAWAATGIFTGGVSAPMGIGGCTICVPVLSYLGNDIRRAVGTSAAGLVIGLPATLVYIATGFGAEGMPPFSLGYANLAAVAVVIPFTTYFAKIEARIAHAIPMRALRMCFGLFLAVTAARMFIDLATAA